MSIGTILVILLLGVLVGGVTGVLGGYGFGFGHGGVGVIGAMLIVILVPVLAGRF